MDLEDSQKQGASKWWIASTIAVSICLVAGQLPSGRPTWTGCPRYDLRRLRRVVGYPKLAPAVV